MVGLVSYFPWGGGKKQEYNMAGAIEPGNSLLTSGTLISFLSRAGKCAQWRRESMSKTHTPESESIS